jgi:hypothetical protein
VIAKQDREAIEECTYWRRVNAALDAALLLVLAFTLVASWLGWVA